MRILWQLFILLGFLATPTFALSDVKSGDMLFVQNSQNIVECWTHSTYSHVAMVIKDGDELWVYEAEIPVVTRYKLKDWLTAMGQRNAEKPHSPAVLTIVAPATPYTAEETAKMKGYLDKQIGRRYSLRGHVRGVPGNGIHCSELTAGAIEASGRINFTLPNYGISPGGLIATLGRAKTHRQSGPRLHIQIKESQRMSWCERSGEWWSKRPTWCLWSCWETLRCWP